MKIQFVLHADFESPGMIISWAKGNDLTYQICRPFEHEPMPQIADFDWLIIMGGPQSPLEINRFPYLKQEIELAKQSIDARKMVLGFCLGAQIIGEALGTKTERSPNKEVGVFPIELTEEGMCDPLLKNLPKNFQVVHWHNDMPGLTKDSKILAFSKGCPRQIVRYLPNVYGFQCHLEPTLRDIEEMMLHCQADLSPGQYVQSKENLEMQDYSEINEKMVIILDNLLSQFKLLTS